MRLKTLPEDFVVEEVARHALDPNGSSLLVLMEKRECTTEDAVTAIAGALGIPRRAIQYAGVKDARAVTRQYCTIDALQGVEERVARFSHPRITLAIVGRTRERLGLGRLDGNRFTITVRDLDGERAHPCRRIPNYYDAQRFSSANAHIGRDILKGEFGAAVRAIIAHDRQYGTALERHVAERANDFVGALRLLPQHTLLMYVHAYQSGLFNELLTRHILAHDPHATLVDGDVPIAVGDAPDADIPLVGFDDLPEAWRADAIELLERDGLTQRDFIIRELPFLTLEGASRKAFVPITDLVISERTADELYAGREKQAVAFTLEKGAYATIAIRCIFR